MKRKLFYTKFALRCFRLISLLCAAVLLFTELIHFPRCTQISYEDWYNIITFIINVLAFCFFIFTSIFPQKLGGLSLVSYVYSCFIIPFEAENYMGILMFFLGTSLLIARGLLKKHKKIKTSLLILVLFILCLTHLRFGLNNFLTFFINTIGGILVISLYTFFMHSYFSNVLVYEDKTLNIACFPKLTERDFRILQKIQRGEKYSIIAKDENITEGSLKNRLHFVFDTMETGDKQGFLSYYDDFELYFDPSNIKSNVPS